MSKKISGRRLEEMILVWQHVLKTDAGKNNSYILIFVHIYFYVALKKFSGSNSTNIWLLLL